jgi:hypothetical protein
VFNAVLGRQYFPSAQKHARVLSILNLGKDLTLPSSKRHISLLDTVDKLFEKIQLARVLREVNERGLLRDEQFGFRPRHSTTLQMSRLVERVNRNFDERRLTGAVFLDVVKAFDTVWDKGLLYKLTVPNVLPVSHIHTSWHAGWHGGLWTRLPGAVQPVCERHTHTLPPRRVRAVHERHGSRSHVPSLSSVIWRTISVD